MPRPPACSNPVAPRWSAAEVAEAAGLPHRPTPEQCRVIEAPPGALLVVAGAGSGKTETMAARVVWLVANGVVAAEEVLGLTFTRKAASELAERVALRLRRVQAAGLIAVPTDEAGAHVLGGLPTISTYHAFAGRLVAEHALRLGVEPDSRLLSEAAAWQLAAEAVHRHTDDGSLAEVTFAESTVVSAVVDLAAELAEHLLEPADVRAEIDRVLHALEQTPLGPRQRVAPLAEVRTALRARRAILPLVEAFTDLKRRRDATDYADQMALAARLARAHPDIGAAERARFRAVLLDEFQDTSEAQLALLRDLFVPAGPDLSPCEPVAERPPMAGVTAVGDPHQAIYGWRGASSATLARFPEDFAWPDVSGLRRPAETLTLTTTWRNDVAVLAAANQLAEPLRADSRVAVAPLVARPGAGPGDLEVARLGTPAQEAAYLVEWLRSARSRAGTTAALLCRKRSQFGVIIDALEAAGLPYHVVGLGGLLLTPEVVDLVALLRVVADPTRGDVLMRLITGPMCRLGAADLDGLHTWARHRQRLNRRLDLGELPLQLDPAVRDDDEGTDAPPGRLVELAPDSVDEPSLVEAVEELPPPGWQGPQGQRIDPGPWARLRGLAAAIRQVRGLSALPLADLVGAAERALGLDVEVLARTEYPPAAARSHLDAFADVAARFSVTADRPTLTGFLAWLDAAEQEERGLDVIGALEPDPEAIHVLTVHAAKGLEWDVVAVPGLVEGTFPTWRPAPMVRPHGAGWRVEDPAPAGWTGGLAGVPYPLRGDRAGLPDFAYAGARDGVELKDRHRRFREAEGRRLLAEERRLAYVALTRARRRLLLTATVWAGGERPRVTSRFLDEILAVADRLGVRRGPWEPLPEPATEPRNPVLEQPRAVLWPADPLATRRASVQLAERAVAAAREAAAAELALPFVPDASPLSADVAALLAERRVAREQHGPVVEIPCHLSTSDLVRLAGDPRGFALEWRRPVPTAPALAARRGTVFHAWVERHYARAALVDVAELPGAADDEATTVPGAPGGAVELAQLARNFLASEWAAREPVEIETTLETVIAGVAVRGRIDAVFRRADGGVTIVDWKTGPLPTDSAQAQVRAVQLGAYALAYARLRQLPPERVDGAFFYAQSGVTVRPDLPDAAQLDRVLALIPHA